MKIWLFYNRWSKKENEEEMNRTLYLCIRQTIMPPMAKDFSFSISLLYSYCLSLFLKHPLFIKWYAILFNLEIWVCYTLFGRKVKKKLLCCMLEWRFWEHYISSSNCIMKLTSTVTYVFPINSVVQLYTNGWG